MMTDDRFNEIVFKLKSGKDFNMSTEEAIEFGEMIIEKIDDAWRQGYDEAERK